jgi:hypothetical protein
MRSLLLFWVFAMTSPALAGDAGFAAARQAFLRDMRKKAPEARVDAINAFARFPATNIVEDLLKKGLADTEPSVRVATRRAMSEIGKDPASANFLQEEFARYVKKQSNEVMLSGLLGGMIATTDESQLASVTKLLDEYLASPKGQLIVPISLIDDLAEQGGVEAVHSITALTRVKPFETQFGYRRCVVQAMSKIREPDAIGFLVEKLPGSQGLVQAEIIEHLTKATGQKFKDNDREWTLWWKENRANFKVPSERQMARIEVDERQPTYYGMPICAKRVVFVLDTSGSMRGVPMEQAKAALMATVDSLPEVVAFNIVMFDKTTSILNPRMLPATVAAKQMAIQTVVGRGMAMGTCSHAALNAAFGLDPEVIYFLSDGEPTDGQPAQIVESLSERNRTRRISIHTIGVVTQRGGGGGLTFFMKPLAEHNFGTFRLVE